MFREIKLKMPPTRLEDRLKPVVIEGNDALNRIPLRVTPSEWEEIVCRATSSRWVIHPLFTMLAERVFVTNWDYRDCLEIALVYGGKKSKLFGPHYRDERTAEKALAYLVDAKCVELLEEEVGP